MQNHQPFIPSSYNYLFDGPWEKLFTEYLIKYILFNEESKTTPAFWQDVEIYIRYKKRDVWTLSKEQLENARQAILIYQSKYIINHLKKSEILEILNKFFTQTDEKHILLTELFEKKIHAPIDSLFLTQEKNIITKEAVSNIDAIFEYPSWIEFTDEANEIYFKKILNDELTDEQIDYFLGASDHMKDYGKWFEIAKHILNITNNAQTFWTAGDILAIVRKAVPSDEEPQKWFRDQIFEIFWPRVKSTWPILNEDVIDFEKDDESQILLDSINWLKTLEDLPERLPELGEDFKPYEYDTDKEDFIYTKGLLLGKIDSDETSVDEVMELFFSLTEYACDESCVKTLKEIAENKLIPLINNSNSDDKESAIKIIKRGVDHAKNYVSHLKYERKNLSEIHINTQ